MKVAKKKKLSKGIIASIISAAAIGLIFLALIIVNIFIPVKYLTAYLVQREERVSGELDVTFVDVGYGDCTICCLPDGKVLMLDGGDGSYPSDLAILKALNERDIDHIDYLVCTSVRSEYCGGLPEILAYKTVGCIFMPAIDNIYITEAYSHFVEAARESGAKTEVSRYGAGAAGEDYFFTFLSPSSPENPLGYYEAVNSSPTQENILNCSAVVWLEYAGSAFAFTSAAGGAALNGIVENYSLMTSAGDKFAPIGPFSVQLERCSVVSVPCHGSENCTSAAWYDLLSPSIAIISVGENYSDEPSAMALADIASSCGTTLLTSMRGNITIKATSQGVALQ